MPREQEKPPKKLQDKVKFCSICGFPYTGWGNNALPINKGRCCDDCNSLHVIPVRIKRLYHADKFIITEKKNESNTD